MPSSTAIMLDDHAWTIETESLALTWRQTGSGDVRLTSLRAAGQEWIASPVPMFSLGKSTPEDPVFHQVTGRVDGQTLSLTGTLDPFGLTVTISWTMHEESSIVVAGLDVHNDTGQSIALGSLPSLQLLVPRPGARQLTVLAGGRWDESMPPRGYRVQVFDLATIGNHSFGAAADGRSSGEYIPWFALTGPGIAPGTSPGGLLVGLVWSGRWSLDTNRSDTGVAIRLGISDFSHDLAPGEHVSLPGMVIAGFVGDLDQGTNAWRDWLATNWMPPTPQNWPWVQYNHWYAYFGDIDEERLYKEATYAADAGCEVFVIDDGWFEGRRPESYIAGWGNWREDRTKFPGGLHAFGDRTRTLGMKFGLWVEPERADPDGELVKSHPGWRAMRDGEPIYRHGPHGTEGVHLCFGNPEVQQWATEELIRVVRDYGVDWMKWDYNMGYGLGCDDPNHGHQATDGHYAHTLGLYRILEELRAACPDLMIENCASGGHRVDLGMLRQTHTDWISDYTHRAASCRQHVQGAGLFLPLTHLNSWVLDKRDTYEFRSRMGGAFGVSDFMGKWSPEERASLATAIGEYKRLRPFLTGERYLLTGPWHQNWDIWQFVHPASDRTALLAFRESGHIDDVQVRLHPAGIDRGRQYAVQVEGDPGPAVMTGSDLHEKGVRIRLTERKGSALIWITARD